MEREELISNLDTQISKIKQCAKCAICLCDLREVHRTLHCGHIFCESCVVQLFSINRSKANCPLCNIHLPTKRSVVSSVKVNEIVKRAHDLNDSFGRDLTEMDRPRRICRKGNAPAASNPDPFEYDEEPTEIPEKPSSFLPSRRRNGLKREATKSRFTAIKEKIEKGDSGVAIATDAASDINSTTDSSSIFSSSLNGIPAEMRSRVVDFTLPDVWTKQVRGENVSQETEISSVEEEDVHKETKTSSVKKGDTRKGTKRKSSEVKVNTIWPPPPKLLSQDFQLTEDFLPFMHSRDRLDQIISATETEMLEDTLVLLESGSSRVEEEKETEVDVVQDADVDSPKGITVDESISATGCTGEYVEEGMRVTSGQLESQMVITSTPETDHPASQVAVLLDAANSVGREQDEMDRIDAGPLGDVEKVDQGEQVNIDAENCSLPMAKDEHDTPTFSPLMELASVALASIAQESISVQPPPTSLSHLHSGYWAPLKPKESSYQSSQQQASSNAISNELSIDDNDQLTTTRPTQETNPCELAPETQMDDANDSFVNKGGVELDEDCPTVVPDSEDGRSQAESEFVNDRSNVFTVRTSQDIEQLSELLLRDLTRGNESRYIVRVSPSNELNDTTILLQNEDDAGADVPKPEETDVVLTPTDAVAPSDQTVDTVAIGNGNENNSQRHENDAESISDVSTILLDVTTEDESQKMDIHEETAPDDETNDRHDGEIGREEEIDLTPEEAKDCNDEVTLPPPENVICGVLRYPTIVFAEDMTPDGFVKAVLYYDDDEEDEEDEEDQDKVDAENEMSRAWSICGDHTYWYQEKGPVVFCTSVFTSRSEISKFSALFGATHKQAFSTDVTHVVISSKLENKRIIAEGCTRKYWQGIVFRKWVVSSDWIVQSVKQGRLLPPGRFEIEGDPECGVHFAPLRARRDKRQILDIVSLYMHGPFPKKCPEEFLRSVAMGAGATIRDSLNDLKDEYENSSRVCLILASPVDAEKGNKEGDVTNAQSELALLYAQCRVPVVHMNWLIASINEWHRLAYQEYLLCPLDLDNPNDHAIKVVI